MGNAAFRWFAVLVVAVALAGVVQHLRRHVLHAGDRLVPLRVSSLYGGDVTLAPGGHAMLVNVFATWCPPCRAETPALAAAAPALRKRGIEVVGIDQEESAQAVAAFARRYALPYQVYIDTSGVTHDLLGARIIPTTMLIDDSGVIRYEHAGPLDARSFADL
jgi:cytochrome c biogenesis protein CcmG/thiol:disulfide interchange protein DsbE